MQGEPREAGGKRWELGKDKSKCSFDRKVEPALHIEDGDIIKLETSDEAYYRLSQGESPEVGGELSIYVMLLDSPVFSFRISSGLISIVLRAPSM